MLEAVGCWDAAGERNILQQCRPKIRITNSIAILLGFLSIFDSCSHMKVNVIKKNVLNKIRHGLNK